VGVQLALAIYDQKEMKNQAIPEANLPPLTGSLFYDSFVSEYVE